MKLSMDTDAMVKLTKAGAKEAVAGRHEVLLAPAVVKEAVDVGKQRGLSDALQIERNLKAGRVVPRDGRRFAQADELLAGLKLGAGEEDALRLYVTARADAVVSDDLAFLRALQSLGVPWLTPAALLAQMVRAEELTRDAGLGFLERLRPHIANEEFLAARATMGGS